MYIVTKFVDDNSQLSILAFDGNYYKYSNYTNQDSSIYKSRLTAFAGDTTYYWLKSNSLGFSSLYGGYYYGSTLNSAIGTPLTGARISDNGISRPIIILNL